MDHVEMDYVEVQDVRIPVIGLGTWQLRGEACRDAVAHALSIGYRHLDTARIYRNEADVGQGLRDSGVDRDEVLVVTKVPGSAGDRDGVRRSVEDSLRDLQLDHVDVLLLHEPSPTPIAETMEAFREQQDAERVRYLGVSNFSVGQLEAATAEAPIVTVQNEHHPRRQDTSVRDWCQTNDVAFTAYSPFGKGAIVRDQAVAAIADHHGKTPAQVVLRWLIQQDNVVTIPRSGSTEHIEQNLDVFDLRLDDDEMAKIGSDGPA